MSDIDLKDFEGKLKKAFSKVKEELSNHLETINENTNEIQANYEYICEINSRIDKLNEKIDDIQVMLSKIVNTKIKKQYDEKFFVEPLTINEKQVFKVIYAADKKLKYSDIAKQTNMSQSLVRTYVTNLIEKGVPITKEYVQGKPLIALNLEFKELQAKKNLVCL